MPRAVVGRSGQSLVHAEPGLDFGQGPADVAAEGIVVVVVGGAVGDELRSLAEMDRDLQGAVGLAAPCCPAASRW